MLRVARATVYHHWPNRADILLDLLRRGVNLDLAQPPADASIEDRVAADLCGIDDRRFQFTATFSVWHS
jgi:AcrR family transcriptional regulator